MKWNKRLKSVLTKAEKSEFLKDCLNSSLRITAESHKSGVSAVIRSDEFRHLSENQKHSGESEKNENLVSAVIRSSIPRHSFKNNDEPADYKTEKFHDILNGFIEAGTTFDVAADDFQVIDGNNKLKDSDRDFLTLNAASVLCHLQQSLLMKHLFSIAPEQFEDFTFEIMERQSLLSITAETKFEIYFFAVKEVTKKWFNELLNAPPKNIRAVALSV